MYQIDFKKPISIHFIGIGGISMSGLAQILKTKGFQITGSDAKPSSLTLSLEALGINIFYGQRASNITKESNLVVYTAAIRDDNPELTEAKHLNIPTMTRAELLGQIMKNYDTPIAISGTHGKTTTTSMVSQVLLEADADPTLSIGGILKAIHGNIRIGQSPYFVAEACEYTNSFLSFHPQISLILNVEEDHMDFFKDIDEILLSFHRFAALLPADGTLIINGDIPYIEKITDGLKCNIITYGLNDNYDYYAKHITYDEFAHPSYILCHGNTEKPITLSVQGEHNVCNSLATLALADLLDISFETAQEGLLHFQGIDRRFEHKGNLSGITIIDDYAHHPTEIKATLTAAKNYPHKTTYCVFQPHTYTRTKAFLTEFAISLADADVVVLADIYPAREKDTLDISSADLRAEILKLGKPCYYYPSFDEIENFLLENCSQGDLLITMGAGDIVKVGEHLLGK